MKLLTLFSLFALGVAGERDDKFRVVTATPELRDIASAVGGDRIEATALVRGPEDPHFVAARPSLIKLVNKADLMILNGMSLEVGYAPLLLAESRNPRIQPGSPGLLDASKDIRKLEIPTGQVDRSQGDVHPDGNPHYLADPMNGKVVAEEIRDALDRIDPGRKGEYDERCAKFCRSVDEAMFGAKILESYKPDLLSERMSQGTLASFLKERGAEGALGGWAKTMLPFAGKPIVTYHKHLAYFARRFDLDVVDALEPKPGVIPSSSHLEKVIATMKARGVRAVFRTVFQPEKPVEKVCTETGATAVLFPHQVEATPEATSYIKMIDQIVNGASAALARP